MWFPHVKIVLPAFLGKAVKPHRQQRLTTLRHTSELLFDLVRGLVHASGLHHTEVGIRY